MEVTKQITVFIDESGTLPDTKDRFVAVCGVAVEEIKEAENVISRVLASLRQTRDSLKLKELKFYHSRHAVKRIFLSAIVASGLKIFVLIVDKQGRKISDDPENFSIMLSELVSEIFLWHRSAKLDLIIDRHFSQHTSEEKFDRLLRSNLDYGSRWQLGSIRHIDSQSNLAVNMADMCAGAVLWKYGRGKDQFYSLIKDNILAEKIANWPEIKRRNLEQDKNSLEPA